MGSLFSSPKRPNIRPIVNSSTQDKAIEVNPVTAVIESGNVNKIRENNLLKRSRGTTGTILTGFNGILGDQAESIPQKKLLGE